MTGKFQIGKASNGQFRFSLLASNGRSILSSELYKSKRGATNGIASVQANSADAQRYERRTSKNGRRYFVLKAANHKVIGRSEVYESEEAMENGISSTRANGRTTRVEDVR